MKPTKSFTGLYGYYEGSNIRLVYTPVIQEGAFFYEEENRIIYHNSPYKIFFLLYKDDFNKAVEECLKFAIGFLNSKIDRLNTN
jgi:hypothetical protein